LIAGKNWTARWVRGEGERRLASIDSRVFLARAAARTDGESEKRSCIKALVALGDNA
jgi:hypothetical protein